MLPNQTFWLHGWCEDPQSCGSAGWNHPVQDSGVPGAKDGRRLKGAFASTLPVLQPPAAAEEQPKRTVNQQLY